MALINNVYCQRILWTPLVIIKILLKLYNTTKILDIPSISYSKKVCPYDSLVQNQIWLPNFGYQLW